MINNPVIIGLSTNEVSSNFHIWDHSIIIHGKRGFCLVFSNTSHDDGLYRFGKIVVDRVKLDISIVKKQNHSKEEKIKIKEGN